MMGMGRKGTVAVGALAGVAWVGLVGCSDDAPAASTRGCAVVQADRLSDLVDADLELEPAGDDKRVCRFSNEDSSVVVVSSVESPVEPGLPKLLLAEPDELGDIGNEAWYSRKDVPLNSRAIVRRGGTMWTLDLRSQGLADRARKDLLAEIAREGVDDLPESKAKDAIGDRSDEACSRYDDDAISTAMGDVPVITAVAPPGSCDLTIASRGLTVRVTPLMEEGASVRYLESSVGSTEGASEVAIEGAAGYWVPSPSGGVLNLLDGERLVQVAVIGTELGEETARSIAGTVAEAAVQG